ncbi:MAG: hypothetical protein A3A33_04700 [Candidatus Yanofskybacteria bacterium RIFCSPLOWO2_01_FULL_49_25]|uniref:Aminotransferase n=1 Tax=Candidatus Yanofskybacteria bacterium RIFCSPLOWO2_01_FULL_49_25 TaxID=1802701 RepID=A0A1F8GPZ8_9BACT|nr:MAG: hypothetical protein A3A33_04700 [Candidatus Yanofskybacteria bacterium RIFCSPLOWO2_01_FULL_49_25]
MSKLVVRNENLYGPAPACMKVLSSFSTDDASRYIGGYNNSLLVPVLARRFSIPPQRILAGYGAEDILRMFFDSLAPGDSVLTHRLHYTFYSNYLRARNIPVHTFGLREKSTSVVFDFEDLFAKYHAHKSALLLITSPNNPTGTTLSARELARIMKKVDRHCTVILDQAYLGFDQEYKEKPFRILLDRYPNLVYVRSFSKQYALAGLRIGYALCGSAIPSRINYQPSYLGMSRVLEQVALAALSSGPYYRKIAKKIINDRIRFTVTINRCSHFKAFDSKANFVYLHVDSERRDAFARALENEITVLAKKIEPGYYRISIGLTRHMTHLSQLISRLDREK